MRLAEFNIATAVKITLALVVMFFCLLTVGSEAMAEQKAASVTRSNAKIEQSDIVFGNPEAEIVVVEYFAPGCVHCSEYHANIFPQIKRKYIDTGRIAYVMREFVGSRQDLEASLLARCTADKNSYLNIMRQILTTQDAWVWYQDYRKRLIDIGIKHNISAEQYELCRQDESKTRILINNAKRAVSDPDFPGTPSFYINGAFVEGGYGNLPLAIEHNLTREVSGN
jgi:protein-disulfide isomerase